MLVLFTSVIRHRIEIGWDSLPKELMSVKDPGGSVMLAVSCS